MKISNKEVFMQMESEVFKTNNSKQMKDVLSRPKENKSEIEIEKENPSP